MDKENKKEEEEEDDDEETSEPSLKRPSITRYTSTTSATQSFDRFNVFQNYSSYGKANSYYNRGNITTQSFNQKPPPPPAEPKTPADKYIPPIKKDGPWFDERAK